MWDKTIVQVLSQAPTGVAVYYCIVNPYIPAPFQRDPCKQILFASHSPSICLINLKCNSV